MPTVPSMASWKIRYGLCINFALAWWFQISIVFYTLCIHSVVHDRFRYVGKLGQVRIPAMSLPGARLTRLPETRLSFSAVISPGFCSSATSPPRHKEKAWIVQNTSNSPRSETEYKASFFITRIDNASHQHLYVDPPKNHMGHCVDTSKTCLKTVSCRAIGRKTCSNRLFHSHTTGMAMDLSGVTVANLRGEPCDGAAIPSRSATGPGEVCAERATSNLYLKDPKRAPLKLIGWFYHVLYFICNLKLLKPPELGGASCLV